MKLIITIEDGSVEISVDEATISLLGRREGDRSPATPQCVRPHAIAGLLDSLGGNALVARSLGLGPSAVSEMKRRNSILPRYWPALISLAQERGVSGVTPDHLMILHSAACISEPQE